MTTAHADIFTVSQKDLIKQHVILGGNILIIGAEGEGKTTVLNDLQHDLSERYKVVTVQDKHENATQDGKQAHVSTGLVYDKLPPAERNENLHEYLKTAPDWVLYDELNSLEDYIELERIMKMGVKVVATLHAKTVQDALHYLLNEARRIDGATTETLESIANKFSMVIQVSRNTQGVRPTRQVVIQDTLKAMGF